ncbi:hypothetical protein ANO14919_056180 [Xylariales sp. No.14919]|nr:hypothetical protein ANO14919_056180 [Xylariales sp. No.14919]
MAAVTDIPTTVLITGANRGLGRALATRFLLRPNTVVIGGVRDPTHATSQSLSQLPRGTGSQLIIVKIDSEVESDAQDAAKLIQSDHGIARLDIIVANAGYGTVYGDLSQVKPDDVRRTVEINVIGPLCLFQAFRPLLEAGERPRFVLMGTPIASIAAMENSPFPMAAYGMSKAAAHYLTRKVHCESPNITAFVIDPGFMQTDMGNTGARHFGYEQAFVPVDVSADFAFDQISNATREKAGGKFLTIDEKREYNEW